VVHGEESGESSEELDIAVGQKSPADTWPSSTIVGAKLTSKASDAIRRQCADDEPWLILISSGGAGPLAAFDDRLVVIRTGALTSLQAEALGGERSTTFYFRDINAIEYNLGLMSGTLEILTTG
jgi:hypothetical protein